MRAGPEGLMDHAPMVTARLTLRPPGTEDTRAIFAAISSDAEVTRFVGWPRHTQLAQTEQFLAFARAEWERWPAGPLLMVSRADGQIVGSTGLAFETPYRASTGYVLARHAWGQGFASEALDVVAALAEALEVRRLYAHCHVDHAASVRVLERCGFRREGVLKRYLIFPNLGDPQPQDVFCYARIR